MGPKVGAMLDETVSIPAGLHHERFVATPLTTDTAALDYASYMASPEVIRVHSDGRWPVEGLTLEDDLELVASTRPITNTAARSRMSCSRHP